MDAFSITIDQFEGPLDLMLHLIKEQKLDLFDLDLVVLCDQYMKYIEAMKDMHLEVASEYLAELAGLLEYKSKKLLPNDKSELEDGYEEDTRERLVQRLLEYDRFKKITSDFQLLYEERSKRFDKPQEEIVNDWVKQSAMDFSDVEGNPYDLIKAMNRVIRHFRVIQPMPMRVARKEMSIEDRNEMILRRLEQLPETFTLEDLCEDCDNLDMVIVTFLSMLDLIHVGHLIAHMDADDTIYLKRGVGEAHESA